MKPNAEHERQRKFRDAHKPEMPPFVGIWLREGDAEISHIDVIAHVEPFDTQRIYN